MDGSTALAILDKKINSVESTVQSVTLGSDKKSIVITTVDGVTFSVSIPNAVDNPTILNKFTVVNGEVYYDGKRIAEYAEIPTATSQLTNDSGFITSANLPNLTPYQPKNDSDLNTTNKTVVGAINELKTNVNNINVPTKTSQLTNDSGYITNSNIPTIPTKVSQLTNDSDYVTQTEMTDAIAGAISGGTVDLTGYQKSNDINLATTNKTVVGAINELKDDIDNFQSSSGGTFETTQLTLNAVGGITTNTDLNGKTWQEIIDQMFYPYTKPVVAVSGTPNGGIFEKGNTQTITNVKATVTKKSKKITRVEVFDGNTSLGSKTGTTVENGGTFNFTVNVSVPSANKQLTAKVTDESGTVVSANTGAFTFIYPYYVGVCSDGVAIDETLVKGLTKKIESKGAKSIAYTTNNERMVFAYPSSYGTIKSIIDPNNFDVTASFVRSTINITGLDGTAQSYYIYVNSASTQSNFTMKFNY